ncbi:ribonuclease T2 isoform X2 [Paroedura picta]|uniref:ribonuclease T2 isoform X2 n=1 Tax=Paroedura picta TaxID=143630 RepID=UPI0040575E50
MKPMTQYCFIVWCFWFAISHGSAPSKFVHSSHFHDWKKFYFVYHWPVTVCKMSENECSNPPMYWTIHGLWTDKAEDCNKTWHFNVTEIKDLLVDMRQYWPDVLHENRTKFWKHEWDKHGTCAATLESLNSQKKYFSKALELYEKLDLNSYLVKLGIKPGNTYYQLGSIKEALTSVYNVTPKIQCLSPEQGEEVQTIGQIKFCFTKDFILRNCTESKVDSYFAHGNMIFGTEELSICNDTLTNYPSHVQLSK